MTIDAGAVLAGLQAVGRAEADGTIERIGPPRVNVARIVAAGGKLVGARTGSGMRRPRTLCEAL